MFGAILDSVDAPALADSPLPLVTVAPRRRGGEGNRLGERHTAMSKACISYSRMKYQFQKWKSKAHDLAVVAFASFPTHVARTCFGNVALGSQKVVTLADGSTCDIEQQKTEAIGGLHTMLGVRSGLRSARASERPCPHDYRSGLQ